MPLAAGIEFGETGEAATVRELHEEIGATPTRVRYLGLVEDIFVWAGQKRHELYLIDDVELADRAVYEAGEVQVVEPDGTSYPARWRPLFEFRTSARLVPDGLLDLVEQSRGVIGATPPPSAVEAGSTPAASLPLPPPRYARPRAAQAYASSVNGATGTSRLQRSFSSSRRPASSPAA